MCKCCVSVPFSESILVSEGLLMSFRLFGGLISFLFFSSIPHSFMFFGTPSSLQVCSWRCGALFVLLVPYVFYCRTSALSWPSSRHVLSLSCSFATLLLHYCNTSGSGSRDSSRGDTPQVCTNREMAPNPDELMYPKADDWLLIEPWLIEV